MGFIRVLRLFAIVPLFLVLGNGLMIAQRTCGTPDLEMLTATQEGRARQIAFETRLQNWQAEHAQERTTEATYIIPTVVHVVQLTSQDLISDACVQSQIDVINEDFQKLNADTNLVPASFLPVLGNVEVEFCLATKDPNGNVTTGINRVVSPFANHNKGTEEDSLKGLIQWPPSQYLNIWVVVDMGNLLGYATFPSELAGSPHRDGVVLNGTYLGRGGNCSAQSPFDLGRTATHEIGHWLGLFHTFQGGCAGTSASNCAIAGDNVCDTPPTSSSTFGCPATKNTCTETPTDMDDMTMNYMDYVNDICMYMFTNGQATRMQAVLGSVRSVLVSQANHTATGCGCSAQSPCAPQANFGADNTTICPGQTVIFSDLSTGPAVSWSWTFAGGNPATSTLQSPSVTYANPGTYPVILSITNGQGSNTKAESAFVNVVQGAAPPMAEGFESMLPSNWQISNADNAQTWQVTSTAASTGSNSLFMDNWNYNAQGSEDVLTTRIVDLSNYGMADFTFDYAYKRAAFKFDTLQVFLSTDCGESWTLEWEKGGQALATVPGVSVATAYLPAGPSDFKTDSIDISNYLGVNGFKAKFVNLGHEGNSLYLDNVNLMGFVGRPEAVNGPGWSLHVRPNPFS
ncbi:MAG TPA: PKD domain-containing protein, partial [Bacteroidetes bacterium]|nr:PKD domain-containing protein [Bacteroidota bacterium]